MSTNPKKHAHDEVSGASMPRNIAVFIDGTWNRAGTSTPTNVRKLFEATLEGVHEGRLHSRLYVPGVGNRPKVDLGDNRDTHHKVILAKLLRQEMPLGFATLGRGLVGGSFGKGTAARIKSTYLHLCRNYDRKRGDQVFLFGFSRGAFAARSLAGFVGKVGLLLADKHEHIERAYQIYERSETAAQTELADYLEQLTGIRVITEDSEYYLPFHFLGVWDTVASLGLPSRLKWLSAPFTEFHQVAVPPSVMTARHALALHELRGLFEPLLWKGEHPDLKQVWFAGAHADVGGGYAVGEDGLADIALRWMAGEATSNGLQLSSSAPWNTIWESRPSVHHEIRGLFLAALPSPRDWLKNFGGEERQRHYFHRSAVEYVRNTHTSRFGFKLPCVNSALRRVDKLALPIAVRLCLMGQEILE